MNKLANFIRLDFLTIKPYLTPRILVMWLVVVVGIFTYANAGSAAVGVMVAMASVYASYPFAVGEKCNIDVLYATLSIDRGTVVRGRYAFALTLILFAGLFCAASIILVSSLLGQGANLLELMATLLTVVLMFSLIQALQLPLYFRFGYARAKVLAYLALAVLPLMVIVPAYLFSGGGDAIEGLLASLMETAMGNLIPLVAVVLAAWLGVQLLSYRIALAGYSRRDF